MVGDCIGLLHQCITRDDSFTIEYGYDADGIRKYKDYYDWDTGETTRHEYLLNGTQIIKETVYTGMSNLTEAYTLIYLYDENASPIGFKYREPSYAADVYEAFFFEKNLQGDIIAIYNEDGVKIGTYTYDAWGSFTVTVSSGVTTLERAIVEDYNSYRYRGYYFDTETGWYYLQSRYYNPEWGRFINADGYVSTGTGILGYNMFAYCGNNPVNRVDPTGDIWWWVVAVVVLGVLTFTGCSEQAAPNVGAASPYTPSNSTDFNCYAYALGEDEWKYVGGSQDAVTYFDVEVVAQMVLDDAKKDGRSMRIIESYDSPIEHNEYRIALRTGESDYHFMVQHDDGSWSHKPGLCSTRLIDGANPSVVSWDAPRIDTMLLYYFGIVQEIDYIHNYYNSDTIYFAVSN